MAPATAAAVLTAVGPVAADLAGRAAATLTLNGASCTRRERNHSRRSAVQGKKPAGGVPCSPRRPGRAGGGSAPRAPREAAMRQASRDGRSAVVRRAVVGAAVSALLAGCGSAVGPAGTSGPADSPAAGLASGPSGGSGPKAGSRAQALALARSLLSRLILPPGTRPVPGKAPGPQVAGSFTMVHQRRAFSVNMPMAAAFRFFMHHAPPGMRALDNGRTAGPGGIMDLEIGYYLRPLPPGSYGAEVDLSVVPAVGGGSAVHADAVVIWFVHRSAAERVNPARIAAVTVNAHVFFPRERTVTRRITSRAAIMRLAGLLNGMPGAPRIAMSCPAQPAYYRAAFAAAAGGRPVLVATTGSCQDVGVSAGGRQQPALYDSGGKFAAVARHLAGLRPFP